MQISSNYVPGIMYILHNFMTDLIVSTHAYLATMHERKPEWMATELLRLDRFIENSDVVSVNGGEILGDF